MKSITLSLTFNETMKLFLRTMFDNDHNFLIINYYASMN